MILVLASIANPAAVAFADDLSCATAASTLTCRDLAEHQLVLRYPDFLDSTITVRGSSLPISAVEGVINLLPAVFPDELIFYPPEEREYQASEFYALITFLLSALPCRVVNRPTPSSLTGPYTNPLGWHQLARRLEIPTEPLSIDSDAFVNPFVSPLPKTPVGARRGTRSRVSFPVPDTEVIYLDGSLISPSGTVADRYTAALARAAPVEYLRAVYTLDEENRPKLHTVSTTPDVGAPATRRALIKLFIPDHTDP